MTERRNDSHSARAGGGIKVVALLVCLVLTCPTSRAETPWERYVELPTPENAMLVDSIAYSDTTELNYRDESDLALLEVQVISSDREAVRLAFRVKQYTGAHWSELLSEMLGRLIRIDPNLFLEVLREYWAGVVRLDALLGNAGWPYVDKAEASCYEMRQRVESISGVQDDSLLEVRQACITELEGQIKNSCPD